MTPKTSQKMIQPRHEAALGQPRGFTLTELLVSMLILAIGILATLSMQFASLGGAMMSRDTSNAADAAKRTLQIMEVQAQQWRRGDLSTAVTEANAAFTNDAFVADNLLGKVDGADGKWVALTANPVDSRLTAAGNARYCIWGRGEYLSKKTGAYDDIYLVNLAVVFPSANQRFASNDCKKINTGDSTATIGKENLDPTLDPATDDKSLQLLGFRVQYFGTQVARRGYLSDQATTSGPSAGSSGGAGT